MLHFKRHEPSVPVEQVTIKFVVLFRHLIFLQSGHLTLPVSSSPTTSLNDKNKLFNYLIIYAVSIFLYIFINGPLGYLTLNLAAIKRPGGIKFISGTGGVKPALVAQ